MDSRNGVIVVMIGWSLWFFCASLVKCCRRLSEVSPSIVLRMRCRRECVLAMSGGWLTNGCVVFWLKNCRDLMRETGAFAFVYMM
jgi:hypothetical protein